MQTAVDVYCILIQNTFLQRMVTPVKATCLNCRYFKIQDSHSGLCRQKILTLKDQDAEKPVVQSDGNCEQWVDCGQTYYIRLGWIKKLTQEEPDQQ